MKYTAHPEWFWDHPTYYSCPPLSCGQTPARPVNQPVTPSTATTRCSAWEKGKEAEENIATGTTIWARMYISVSIGSPYPFVPGKLENLWKYQLIVQSIPTFCHQAGRTKPKTLTILNFRWTHFIKFWNSSPVSPSLHELGRLTLTDETTCRVFRLSSLTLKKSFRKSINLFISKWNWVPVLVQ